MSASTKTLYAPRWLKLQVKLRNSRNTFAKEPPVAIFDAVFRSALASSQLPRETVFFFHPRGRGLGNRIRRGSQYDLEVIFPDAAPEGVESFAHQLKERMQAPQNNFTLESVTPPIESSLKSIESATSKLDGIQGEICLYFHAPLSIGRKDPKRPWRYSAAQLFESIATRLNRLFNLQLVSPTIDSSKTSLLTAFWHYQEHRHRSKSSSGVKLINGWEGPLYLKGEIAHLLPWLRIGHELHAGNRIGFGQGYYSLDLDRPHFDPLLTQAETYIPALIEASEETADPDPFLHPLDSHQAKAHEMAESIRDQSYTIVPCRVFQIEKGSTGNQHRTIGVFDGRDRVLQRTIHRILTPALDRLFEDESLGYRPGRSIQEARKAITRAWKEGYTWVLESDVESFFDEIDWDLLSTKVRRVLPLADHKLIALLESVIRCPITERNQVRQRQRGLLQGSPLSPLLANLYLDQFDESVQRANLRMIRYADDFLILCKSREEAQLALNQIRKFLEDLKLSLNEDKTRITPAETGFSFLGMDLGAEMDEEFVERTALRKPLFIRQQFQYIGLNGDTVELRQDSRIQSRFPLNRIGEIVVFGTNSLSSQLLRRCVECNIPVSFCTAGGYYVSTLRPDSKRHFELGAKHHARRESMPASDVLATARRIVAAKFGNYFDWIRESTDSQSKQVAKKLEHTMARLETCESLESLRGSEGSAATLCFHEVNKRARPEFKSESRGRREKADIYNVLLNFAYFLLFTRINVILRSEGLNPYLGFLHSPKDNFESLVCDLQEPFRARMDRLVISVINRQIIQAGDFQRNDKKGWLLSREASNKLVQSFEKECQTRRSRDGGTLIQLLHAQVMAVKHWTATGETLKIYRR